MDARSAFVRRLFVSPFVRLVSVCMVFLNHAKVDTTAADSIERLQHVTIPAGLETARGREAVERTSDRRSGRRDRRDWIRALRPERAADRHLGFQSCADREDRAA